MADYTSKVVRFEKGDDSFELIPEVLEFSAASGFPVTGTVGVLYIDKATNSVHRWNEDTSAYIKIGEANRMQIVEASTSNGFPATGASNTLYVDKSTNYVYCWNSTNSRYENVSGATHEEVNAQKVISISQAINIPDSGTTVSYNVSGLTANHILMFWRFSTNAENDPPTSLTWTTYDGYFTIENFGIDSNQTIKPVFALIEEKTATLRTGL